jgi:hypothetical protein
LVEKTATDWVVKSVVCSDASMASEWVLLWADQTAAVKVAQKDDTMAEWSVERKDKPWADRMADPKAASWAVHSVDSKVALKGVIRAVHWVDQTVEKKAVGWDRIRVVSKVDWKAACSAAGMAALRADQTEQHWADWTADCSAHWFPLRNTTS